MDKEYIIDELPKGIFKWYPFRKNSNILNIYISNKSKTSSQEISYSKEEVFDFTISSDELINYSSIKTNQNRYDYIISNGLIEYSKNPVELLKCVKLLLAENGVFLLAADNRLSIRYFCGDRDEFTNRNFDGIENYSRLTSKEYRQLTGRAYAKFELKEMLFKAGFEENKFFSVFPGNEKPQLLFSEEYTPKEELDVRIFPQYHNPDTIFLQENSIYSSLVKNNMLHSMANGYLIECTKADLMSKALQVTLSIDRGKESALATIIRKDNKVEKKALYKEGNYKLVKLIENNKYLSDRGIKCIPATIQETENDSSYIMPNINGIDVTSYFRNLMKENVDLFYKEFDRFYEEILKSSELVDFNEIDWKKFDPDWEKAKEDNPDKDKWKNLCLNNDVNFSPILKRGYIDLVSHNCFVVNGEFVFFDQEFYIENLPAFTILTRTIDFLYWNDTNMNDIIPIDKLRERYHIEKYANFWHRFSDKWIEKLRNEEQLRTYYMERRVDYRILQANRLRMNYSQEEYQRLFVDTFKGIESKDIYLFGSGKYTKLFMSEFGHRYKIKGIIDNNSNKWGELSNSIEIISPSVLKDLIKGTYRIIICIKEYQDVVEQLKNMNVSEYAIYNPQLTYSRDIRVDNNSRLENVKDNITGDKKAKPYHVGYVAGVFDLFHIGHLNLLKRAKEQCDYLIVGVVNDESVMINKKSTPCIPFNERIEIVRACRYVDEAVEIPTDKCDTDEAYRRYQFDVQFSGSDYEHDPIWLAKREYLQKRGADLIFFPYTKGTSSTKLKRIIERKRNNSN